MLLGRAYLAQNDLGQDYLVLAQRAFDEAAATNPGYAEAQAFAGFVRDQRGADGGAWLDRAVEIDPDLIVARYFRARHRWERSDLDGALARSGRALVISTHDVDFARSYADRAAVLAKGVLVEYGDAESVLSRPQHAATRELLSAPIDR